MAQLTRLSLALSLALSSALSLGATGCGFPRPPTLSDDSAPGGDSARRSDAASGTDGASVAVHTARSIRGVAIDGQPSTTIPIALTASGANDGVRATVGMPKPVRATAETNTVVKFITLEAGGYTAYTSEEFSCTVPSNLTISGQATGVAILTRGGTQGG